MGQRFGNVNISPAPDKLSSHVRHWHFGVQRKPPLEGRWHGGAMTERWDSRSWKSDIPRNSVPRRQNGRVPHCGTRPFEPSIVLDDNGVGGTAVAGLVDLRLRLLRDGLVGLGHILLCHIEHTGADIGAEPAANAVAIYIYFHVNCSFRIF